MNCMQVARVLQSYLDGETDEVTARRVSAHLEDCRRCGLEASVYQEIHNALARRTEPDSQAMERLQAFGASLLTDPPTADDDAEHSTTPPTVA
ncbi:zf-HC2 domain-containing protein [Streptomyces sp. ISL-112]|uniref:anti-sigma factor family protein n=1 Tax=unclassified Streptomyces TaxID=2593676 RepID=UPI001BE5BDD0|nr:MULTISPECIES: anti-sigma factor [unclassified Streptomyces]MBT2430009.1 zf-HC2 domain-containing protein [Streptomyces sp. ISL-112]MBT2461469.1 zf-HC2 domain-containing protein [Streptomyces sp. ISL-63]